MDLAASSPVMDYEELAGRIAALVEGEDDPVALMATIACEVHHFDPAGSGNVNSRVYVPRVFIFWFFPRRRDFPDMRIRFQVSDFVNDLRLSFGDLRTGVLFRLRSGIRLGLTVFFIRVRCLGSVKTAT